ncbi:hypothetical protein FS749_008165 [Ceratobasidium sp. UAMH 11750]|nr:hypothetical protein FS749_008165 [Ceratobasidium sp. UAMH 11750]
MFSNIFPHADDLPPRPNLTRTPSTCPTSMILDDMQPKAKRRSLDFSVAALTMPRLLLTPNRSKHREPVAERSSPPEGSSPASPTAQKHRLGLPLPCTPGAENHSWHCGMDVNSESIRKVNSDSPSRTFPNAAKGKGCPREHTWDPSTHKLKGTRRLAGGIFADPGSTAIPIPEQVPSADPTSPFVLQTAASNAPKDFVAPAFSLSAFSPPWTSSPFKVKPRRTGGLFENEMGFGGEGRAGGMENEMFPSIAMSSPGPKRAPKRAPLASIPRLNVDGRPGVNSQVGHASFSDVSSLLSGPLKKRYQDNDDLVTPQFGPGMASAWPDVKDSDEQDLDQEIFNSMVSHTSFSIDRTGAGGGAGGGMPGTPVKKAVFGTSGVGVGGGSIAMGGARGRMTTLPDHRGKAFGGRNDDSPAAGRSKLPTIDSNESPTMHQFWNPGGPDESPSLRPRRKSGDVWSPEAEISRGRYFTQPRHAQAKTADSPKRPPLGGQRRSYGSLRLG